MWKFLFQVLIGICLSVGASAQYRFDAWTTDNGLPQNSVLSVAQTADGYLWMTTLDGLVRFDGVNFKVFNKSNSPGLLTNRLTYLFVEKSGVFWIATENSGLTRYQNGEFHTFTTADGLPSNDVNDIVSDFDGSLLIATRLGMARFRDDRFVKERDDDSRVFRLYCSASGARWEINSSGLQRFKNGQNTRYQLPFDVTRIAADRTYNYPFFVYLYEDRRQNLWLGADAKLFKLSADGAWTSYGASDGIPKNLIRSIVEDAAGAIWLGVDGDGLCRFADERAVCYLTDAGLSAKNVLDVFVDRENTLWAGTNSGGVNRVSRQIITTLGKKDGLLDSNIYPILQDRNGTVWMGANSALSKYENGEITNFTRKQGLLYEIVQSLYEDRDNRLWIGSIGGIEYLENGKFTDFTKKLNINIGDDDFRAVHQDRSGAMWFATNKGLFKYENDAPVLYTTRDGLPSNDVTTLFETRDNTLLIGTYGGIVRLRNGRFETLREKDGLAGNHVRSFFEEADGTLWIGTYDSGLSRLKDGKFTNYTTGSGLFSNGVFAIVPDERGNFWMSSNQGIYRVNRSELNDLADGKINVLTSTAFGKSDGMLTTEGNGGRQPASLVTADGRIWFPTQNGVSIVEPESVSFNSLPPPVVIEAVKINNQPVANFSSAITLEPGQENLEIVYAGLSFIKPEQVRFRYKLENLDQEWTNAGARRSVYFPYLPPGNYTFRLVAANSDNVWNETGATLSITVKPHFYRTNIFYAACALTIGMLGFGVYRRRVSQLEKARRTQEDFSRRLINAHELERRRVAAELHDSIGQTLAMIKNRAVFGSQTTNDAEKAREQFDSITSQTTQAISEVREISYNLRPYLLERLGLTKAIKSLVNKIAEVHLLKVEARIDEVDDVFAPEAEMSVYRIIQESLNNIAKHADTENARLTIGKTADFVLIEIEDFGRGFDRFAPAKTDAAQGGFGLLGISERVRMLGGTLDIQTEIDRGTKLTIKIRV